MAKTTTTKRSDELAKAVAVVQDHRAPGARTKPTLNEIRIAGFYLLGNLCGVADPEIGALHAARIELLQAMAVIEQAYADATPAQRERKV